MKLILKVGIILAIVFGLIFVYLYIFPPVIKVPTSGDIVTFSQDGNQVSIKIKLEGTDVPRYNRVTNVGDNPGDMRNLDQTIQFGGTTTTINLPTHFEYTSITIYLIISDVLEGEVAQIWFKNGVEFERG